MAKVTAAAEREVIPLYEVRPQMRLGYLTDLDSIHCTSSDPERGFTEGTRYPLQTDSRINVTSGQKVTRNKKGEPVVRKYEEEAKVLLIKIADEEFSESTQDIEYLLEHFSVPNPGDIATRFPEEVERQRQMLDEIAADGRANGKDPAFDWKRFQREDLARALTKTRDGGGFILCWEQGGGKTLGAAGYALGAPSATAHATKCCSSSPRILIPQYRQDISEKLGIEVEHITTPAQARRVARHLRAGGEGWYITHYEVLSLLGVKNEALPVQNVPVHEAEGERIVLDSTEFCPACRASRHGGWQKDSPLVCSAVHTEEVGGEVRSRTCGYVHKRLRVKSAAHHLAGAFARRRDLHRRGHPHQGRRLAAQQGDPRATGTQQAAGDRHADLQLRQPNLLADVVVPGRLKPALPLQLRRRARRVRGRLLRPRVHLRPPGIRHGAPREKRKVLPQITNVSRFWRLVGRRDDPPAQARLRRADRPLHPEDRQRPDGRRPARALQALAEQGHVRVVLRLEVPRPPARGERPDRAVRRRLRPAHEARVRHHRAGGRDRPRLARPRRT